jgi:hypothetical protein
METTKPEVSALLKLEETIRDLNELDLALVGGGVGDVILA